MHLLGQKSNAKTMKIEKQWKRLHLRAMVEIYNKITEKHMSYRRVEEEYGISGVAMKQ